MMQSDEQVTRIFAVRHGETDWNVQGRIQGQLDVALNAKGRWQVQRVAEVLSGEALAAIYASDLLRAFETASAIAGRCGLHVVTDPGLRERGFGTFEGLTFDEIRKSWPQMSERWRRRDPEFGAPGGETLNDFYLRSVACIERLAVMHPGQAIAIVSHGGVMDCLYRAATRIALDAARSWQLGNASINRLLLTSGGLSLVGWNDTFHLEGVADETMAEPVPKPESEPA
jgi:probable phosphoglycerate mutase